MEWSGVREKESAACPLNEVRNHSFNYERHSNGATAAAPSTDNSWRKSMKKKERERDRDRERDREGHAESAQEALLTSLGTFRRISFYVTGALAQLEQRRDLRAAIYGDA